jgi:hypothetical protein
VPAGKLFQSQKTPAGLWAEVNSPLKPGSPYTVNLSNAELNGLSNDEIEEYCQIVAAYEIICQRTQDEALARGGSIFHPTEWNIPDCGGISRTLLAGIPASVVLRTFEIRLLIIGATHKTEQRRGPDGGQRTYHFIEGGAHFAACVRRKGHRGAPWIVLDPIQLTLTGQACKYNVHQRYLYGQWAGVIQKHYAAGIILTDTAAGAGNPEVLATPPTPPPYKPYKGWGSVENR